MNVHPTVFVGGLDSEVTESELFALFNRYCEVHGVKIVRHSAGPLEGVSRGFGFVEVKSADDVAPALQLHGLSIRGRMLRVEKSREKQAVYAELSLTK